jgi:hypothetical protein
MRARRRSESSDELSHIPATAIGGFATFSHHELSTNRRSTEQEYVGMGTLIAVIVFCGLAIALWNASRNDSIVRGRFGGNAGRGVPATPTGTPATTDPLI